MDENKEMLQNFSDMVNATERMAKPWQDECQRWKEVAEKKQKHHTIRLVLSNLFWLIITCLLVWFAYMTPIESTQDQELPEGRQRQTYSQGVTDGG